MVELSRHFNAMNTLVFPLYFRTSLHKKRFLNNLHRPESAGKEERIIKCK